MGLIARHLPTSGRDDRLICEGRKDVVGVNLFYILDTCRMGRPAGTDPGSVMPSMGIILIDPESHIIAPMNNDLPSLPEAPDGSPIRLAHPWDERHVPPMVIRILIGRCCLDPILD